MKLYFLVLLLILSFESAAQLKIKRLGLSAEYGVLSPTVDVYAGDKYHIYSTGSTLDGFQLGAFVNFGAAKSKGYLYSQLSYFQNRSLIQFDNLKPEEDLIKYGFARVGGSGMYTHNMFRIEVGKSIRILKNLTVSGGLIAVLQQKDKHYIGYPESYFDNSPYTPSKIIYRFAEEFNKYIFLYDFQISYLFGPLSLSLSMEKNITSVSQGVEYENVLYPFRFNIKTVSFGVAYTIFQF